MIILRQVRRLTAFACFAALAASIPAAVRAQTASVTTLASGLQNPSGVAVDAAGNVYVGETSGQIRKITPQGTMTVFGQTNTYPYGMTCDAAGNVYVSSYNNSTVYKITPAGAVSTYAQIGAGYYGAIGLAFDQNGNLFAASRNPAAIFKVTPSRVVTQWVTLPNYPVGMASDSAGNLYVGYTGNFISKVTPTGAISTFATGVNSGYGVAVDRSGNVFVADYGASQIRKITPAGVMSTYASITYPWGVAVDANGVVYTDSYYSPTGGSGVVYKIGSAGFGVNFSADTWNLATSDQPGQYAGANWNNVGGASGSGVALKDYSGTTTSAQLSFSATGAYAQFPAPATANAATNQLYRGGVFGDNATREVSVTVTNVPYAYYDVYVYAWGGDADGHTLSLSNGTTTYYYRSTTLNGGSTSLIRTTSTDAAAPTTGEAQYQVFHGMSGSSFTLTTGGSINNVVANNIMGFQVVAVPAPAYPVINSATSANGTYNTPFSYTITATNTPTAYNATNLPAGLSIDTRSGVISGTPQQSGTFSIGLSATNAGGTGTATLSLTIAKAALTITLSDLAQTYDGAAKAATATTNPANVAVSLNYSGPTLPPVNAGSYGVIATSADANYTGTATGTLTIAPAAVAITLGNLNQSYDGQPKAATVTTDPEGVAVTLTYNGSADAPTQVGNYTVEAKPASANYTGSATGTLTIADTTPPVIHAPANLELEATSAAGAVATFAATANDDVDGSVAVTADKASGSTFALGTTTVTLTATDKAGNKATASFTVTVKDTTAPTLTVPAAAVIEAANASGAPYTFAATATDAVTAAPTITYNQAPGTVFPLGTTTVQVTATDAAGNKAQGTFTVTVRDTTPPVLTVPANLTLEATSAAGAVANFAASAVDAVTTAPAIAYSVAPGTVFPLGTTTVQVTATDAAGNQSAGAFTVTVRDTTAPTLTVPASLTIEATSAAGAVANFAASATDAVTAVPAIAYSVAPGTVFPIGTTTVQVTATDDAGNRSAGAFTVTVRDTTPPALSALSASVTTIWPVNKKMVAVTLTPTVTDTVGVASVKIVSVTTNEPDNKIQWQITGDLSLNLLADRLGTGNGRIYTITVEALDAAGNAARRSVVVTVPHDQGK